MIRLWQLGEVGPMRSGGGRIVALLAGAALSMGSHGCFSPQRFTTTPEEHAALQALAYKDHSRGGILSGSADSPENASRVIQQPTTPRAPSLPPAYVTTGDVSQQYEVLGPVHFDTAGMVNVGSVLSDALFKSRFERAVGGATPTLDQEAAFAKLLDAANAQYGSVHAVINATYRAEHSGRVYADGLAVRFVTASKANDPALTPPASTEARLEELKRLVKKKLITQKEYDAKRAEILNGL